MNVKDKFQFATVVLAWELVFCSLLVAGLPPLQASAAPLRKKPDVSHRTVNARELPADQYARLKTLALSGARALSRPRVRNPQVSGNGQVVTVNATLDEQREYLSRSRSLEKRSVQMMLRREAPSFG